MMVLLVFSPVSDSRSSISFPLTSSASSAGACPLWRCACEKRCTQIPFSITWAQTHTHTHTHTPVHTYTCAQIHVCNHMVKQTCCYSWSVIATDSYKRTQTGCDVQVKLYKSWISVPLAPVTRCCDHCYVFPLLMFCESALENFVPASFAPRHGVL